MLRKPAQSQGTSTHSNDIRLSSEYLNGGEMASFVMNEKQTGVGRMRATLELQPIWEEPSVVHIPCDPSCGLLPGCDWATSAHRFQTLPPTLSGALAEGTPVAMGGEVPDMLLYFSVAYCDGKVWLFGGVDHSGSLQDTLYCMQPPDGEPSKTDPIYDRLNDMFRRKTVRKAQWEHVRSSSSVVPRGRALHSLAGIPAQHKLVLFGGFCSDGVLGDTWIFDTRARQWTEPDSPWGRSPSARMGQTAVVVDSKVYLFSGWGEAIGGVMGFLEDTWCFNAGTESWDRLQGPLRRLGSINPSACQEANPCGRYLHLSCHYNNYVYVLGGLGRSPIRPLKDMWRFSIEAEVWERVAFRGVPPRPDYVLWLPIDVIVGDRWVVCPDYEFHFERRRWMLAHSAPLAQEAIALQRRSLLESASTVEGFTDEGTNVARIRRIARTTFVTGPALHLDTQTTADAPSQPQLVRSYDSPPSTRAPRSGKPEPILLMHSDVHLLRELVTRAVELCEKPTTVSRLLGAQHAKAQLPESYVEPCQDCVHPFPHCSAVLVPFPFDQCSSASDGLPRVMLLIGGRGDRSEVNRVLAISELSEGPTQAAPSTRWSYAAALSHGTSRLARKPR